MSIYSRLRERYDSDGLIRHSLLVMIFTHMGSAANMIFHMIMGRTLSEVEYGVLASMLGLGLIFATPLVALINTLAHFTATLKEQGKTGSVRVIMRYWFRRLAPFSLLILILGLASRYFLTSFFNLDSPLPIIITTLILSITVFSPIFPGIFQGLQSFVWMCVAYNGWGIVRLVLGTLLVLSIGPLALYALTAQFVGYVLGLLLGLGVLMHMLKHEPEEPVSVQGTDEYFLRALVVLIGFAFLMNADIVMVKHYFSPEQAGIFAQVATIGRIMVFLVQPIAGAMFPKVISGGETSREHSIILLRAIAFAVLITLFAVVGGLLLPWLPLRVIFGIVDPSVEQIQLLRIVICAMAPLGLTFLLLNYELAQHRFGTAWPLVICAVLYGVGVHFWHGSLAYIAYFLGAMSLISLLIIVGGVITQLRAIMQTEQGGDPRSE